MRAPPNPLKCLLVLVVAGCTSHDPASPVPPGDDTGGAAGASGSATPAGSTSSHDGGEGGGSGAERSAAGAPTAAGAAGDAPLLACGEVEAPRAWPDWVMPNPVASGLPHPASYAVNESGEQVTDEVTGLVWQRRVPPQSFGWQDAKSYCSCLNLDGDDDWRLPSRIELASLVDWTKVGPSIDSDAFPETTSENFWTSSEVGIDPGLIYLVFFLNGHTTYAASDYEYRVRCVRSAVAPGTERYAIEAGVVKDAFTQLSWQQQTPSDHYGFSEAGQYCAGLTLDGGGWRLPSINELQTLVDETKNPSINLTAFPGTPSEYFWSSSPVIDDASRAWTTFFTNGSTYSFAASSGKNVRCVR
ncbi:MAG TPA: DUF1566 domain-containing protein [Polyangiaceae bacterium]|nr:DUF1566 domain-containing protein [Polyangiaceae bacterium]